MKPPCFSLVFLLLAPAPGLTGADQPSAPRAPAPVSVSSLNYANTSRSDLLRLEEGKDSLNPVSLPPARLARPQRYVFLPGELYESDLGFDEICRRLADPLAKKGYLNATDEQGRVIAPQEVDLILRVHSGERPWRKPTARTDRLTWDDGLAVRPRGGRSLTTLGADVVWEERAGGNDDALDAAAVNQTASTFGSGNTPGAALPATSAAAMGAAASSGGAYGGTRDFYLIVVDAFSYPDLKQNGRRAKRLWTTFVAAPRQPGQKFSDVLNTMLRAATPYFGENTAGLQVFDDARASVNLGELRVLDTDVKVPDRK